MVGDAVPAGAAGGEVGICGDEIAQKNTSPERGLLLSGSRNYPLSNEFAGIIP
jgi:hypothetical protein